MNKFLEYIRNGRTIPHHKKFDDHTLLSISYAVMKNELKTYPIYVIINQKTLVTLRCKDSAIPTEYILQSIKDSASKPSINPSFVLCEILLENTNKNLDVVMELRKVIEKLEKKQWTNHRRQRPKRFLH